MILKTFEDLDGKTKVGSWVKANAVNQAKIDLSNVDAVEKILNDKSVGDIDKRIDKATEAASKFGTTFSNAFDQVKSSINNAKDVDKAMQSMRDNITKTAQSTSLLSSIKNIFNNQDGIGAGLKGAFSNIGNSLLGVGKKILSGIGNTLITMAISTAIQLGTKLISYLVNRTKQLQQDAAKAGQKVDENLKNIDDYKSQVAELKNSLENDNLSESEAYDVRAKLVEIQDELISNYGEEAKGLDLVASSAEDAADAINGIGRAEMSKWLTDHKEAVNNAVNYASEQVMAKSSVGDFLTNTSSTDQEFKDQIKRIVEKYGGSIKNNAREQGQYIEFQGTREEVEKAYNNILSDIESLQALSEDANTARQQIISTLTKTRDYYIDDFYNDNMENANRAGEYKAKTDYVDYYKELIQTQDEYHQAVQKGDTEAIQNSVQALDEARHKLGTLTFSSLDEKAAQKYLSGILDDVEKETSKTKVRLQFETGDKSLDDLLEKIKNVKSDMAETFSKSDFNVDLLDNEKTIEQYQAIAKAAEDANISVADFIDIMQEYGYCIDENSYKQQKLKADMIQYSGAVKEVSSIQEKANAAISGQTKDGISIEAYEELKKVLPNVDDALDSNGTALQLNYDKLRDLQKEKAEITKNDLQHAIAEESAAWAKNAQAIDEAMRNYDNLSAEEQKELQSKVQLNQAIANQITQYDLLISKLNYATSGYKAWLDAQSAPDTGDINDAAVNAAKHLDKVFNYDEGSANEYGRYNSVVAKAAEQFIIPQDVIDKGYDAMAKYYNGIKQYLTGDASAVQAFYDAMVEKGLASYDELEGYKIKPGVDTSDIESQMHMTHDVVTGMLGESEEFGFTISFADEDVTAAIAKVQELQSAEAELNAAKLKPEVDTTEMENKVEKLKKEVGEIPDEVLTEVGVTFKDGDLKVDEKKLQQTVSLTYNKSDTEKLIEDYRNINDQIKSLQESGNFEPKQMETLLSQAEQYEEQLRNLPDSVKELYNVNEDLINSGTGIASLSETVKDYQTALAAAAEAKEKLKQASTGKNGMEVDSPAYKNLAAQAEQADAKVQQLKQTLEQTLPQLQESGKIDVDVNIDDLTKQLQDGSFDFKKIELPVTTETSELEGQIASIEQRIAALQTAKVNITGDTTQFDTVLESLTGKLSSLQDAQISVTAIDHATGVAQSVDSAIKDIPEKHVTAISANAITSGITTFKQSLDTLPTEKKVRIVTEKVTYNKTVNTKSSSGGSHELNGTAHIYGTALSGGNWGAPRTETALTGELGREIVVRGSRWFTVGDNGAEFFKIQKGDVVFNHKQTESLLQNGYVNGRGQSYVQGTAYVIGGGKLPIIPTATASGSNSSGNQKASSPTPSKRDTTTTKVAESKLDDLFKAYAKLYDWIVIKLDRVAKATNAKIDKIDDVTNKSLENTYKKTKAGKNKLTKKGQLGYINDAISATRYEERINTKAAKRYDKQAKKVAIQTGLENSIIKKIHNGTIDINSYGENTQKKIAEYKKWYDAAQDCLETVTELNKQEHELQIRRLETIQKYYENRAGRFADQYEVHQSYLDRLEETKTGEGALFSKKNKTAIKSAFKGMKSDLNQQYKMAVKERHDLQTELDKQVKSGNIKKNSDEWFEWTSNINAASKAANEAKQSLEELNNTQSQMMLENIQKHYDPMADRYGDLVNAANARLDLISTNRTGEGWLFNKSNKKDINTNFSSAKANLNSQQKILKAELKQLQAGQKTIKKNTAEWFEWQSAINATKESIIETKNSLAELNNTKSQMMLENIQTYYGKFNDYRDVRSGVYESTINRYKAQGKDRSKGKDVTASIYQKQINEQIAKEKILLKQRNTLESQFKTLVKDGTIKKYSADWYEWKNAIYDTNKALQDTKSDIAELKKTKFEINVTNLNHLLDRLEAVRSKFEQLMDVRELQGYYDSSTKNYRSPLAEYTRLIKTADEEISNYFQQRKQYENEIKQMGYNVGSEKWHELQDNIEQCNSAIISLKKSQEEWNDSIIDIRINALKQQREEFEKMSDAKDKQLKLEKALEALEKARAQRTKLIYREGQGFVYESDQDAIKAAQEDLNEIYYQDVLDKFDDAIDKLDALKYDKNIYDFSLTRLKNTQDIEKATKALSNATANVAKVATNAAANYQQQHFASGTKSVPHSGLSVVDEVRPELISRGRYTWLEKGDTVFPAHITDNLWGIGSNPERFFEEHLQGMKLSDVKLTSNQVHNANLNITGGLVLPNITNESSARELVNELSSIAIKATQRVRRD